MNNFKHIMAQKCFMAPDEIETVNLSTHCSMSAAFGKGYRCTKILIANFLMGLKGLKMYKARVALKRKIAFPLFNTIKVYKRKNRGIIMKI